MNCHVLIISTHNYRHNVTATHDDVQNLITTIQIRIIERELIMLLCDPCYCARSLRAIYDRRN